MAEQTIPKTSARPAGQRRGGGNMLKKLLYLVLAVIVLFVLYYAAVGGADGAINRYPKNHWQAVFLSNGQVYFGHVNKVTKKSVVLEDIYYLQVVTQPLQRSQEGTDTAADQQQEQRLTLIKLGNEIHGPFDRMNINRDQVVLVENLKDDSRVVEAITRYVNEQQSAQ